MIVTSASGKQVSIIENKHGILVDTLGNWWTRDAEKDTSDAAGYSNQDKEDYIQLTRPELKRVCGGNTTIQQLTTVAEMRDYTSRLKADLRKIADDWNDQQLREILIEADTDNRSCISLLLYKLNTECGRREAEAAALLNAVNEDKTEECVSCERESTSLELERSAGTDVPPKKKAKRKPKEYVFRGTYADTFVQLTEKQVTMMLAVAHVSRINQTLQVTTAAVLREVVNEMSPISAGAVLSTLREKHLIVIDKVVGVINPTGPGARVMDELVRQVGGEFK
jgi:hypothetical protein